MQPLYSCALGRIRTCDQEIRRLLLYPLSYEGGVYGLNDSVSKRYIAFASATSI